MWLGLSVTAAVMVASVLLWLWAGRATRRNFTAAVQAANASGRYRFPLNPDLGTHGIGLAYDVTQAAALYVAGKASVILPASAFVRGYTESKPVGGFRPPWLMVIIETSNPQHRRLAFRVETPAAAQAVLQRLAAFTRAQP